MNPPLIPPKTKLTLRYGTTIKIGDLMGSGGEGTVFHAVNRKTGQPGVYKILKNYSPEMVTRTQFLVDQRLPEVSELICGPLDFCANGHLGHFSPLAEGISLEDYLDTPGANFTETYKLAIAFCHGHALLNQLHIAHGDPALCHAKVHETPLGWVLRLIDCDNYRAPRVPLPTMMGKLEHMAPELRRAYHSESVAYPDELSDLYAITTVLHNMLLAKDPAYGFDDTPETFERAMSGGWPHDPARGTALLPKGGYPSAILNAQLARMIRLGLSRIREERPSAAGWTDVLSQNFSLIYIHSTCNGPSFIDPSKTHCPICGQPFPTYKLVFPSLRREIVCDRAAVTIGRTQLPNPNVSNLHAVIRKYGQETRLESFGQNGTYRFNGSQWMRLDGQAILQAGDRLRFASVEGYIEEIT